MLTSNGISDSQLLRRCCRSCKGAALRQCVEIDEDKDEDEVEPLTDAPNSHPACSFASR